MQERQSKTDPPGTDVPRQKTVLVVEDEPLVAKTSRRRIEALGWIALGPLQRAEEAVEWAVGEPPDLILMDVKLLGPMTGPEAARIILERTGVHSVFATGSTDRATIESCKLARPLGYMIKPVDGTMFETTMELAMHSAEMARAHKREQEARRCLEMRHAQVLRHSADAVLMLDASGRILVFSPAAVALFGVSEQEALGGWFAELFVDRTIDFAPGLTADAARVGGTTLRCELEAHGASAEILVDLNLSWFLENDELLAVAIVRDMSESALLKRQLDHAQRLEAVSKLTPSIVHDFNNLLQAIAANQYVLSIGAEPAAQKLLSECAAVLEQGAGLTNQLLDLGSLKSRRPCPLSLTDAVRRTANVANRLLAPHIQVKLELGDGLGPVCLVPGELEQVLLNLVLNARQAMPEGGTLKISASTHPELGDHALIVVEDTGLGMDTDTQARAFEPFFTTRPGGIGSGLGLSTVKRLVETWGGGVELQSELGRGTSCLLSVPFGAQEGRQPHKLHAHPSGQEMILLIEPATHVRTALVRSLTAHGYSVLAVHDADELTALLPTAPLIDVVVHSTSLRELANTRLGMDGVPRIELCGSPDLPWSPGVTRLMKPFSMGELLRALRGVLEARSTEPPATHACG